MGAFAGSGGSGGTAGAGGVAGTGGSAGVGGAGGLGGGAGARADAGWPVREVSAGGFTFTELPSFTARTDLVQLTAWNGQLFGADATGPLWVRNGAGWDVAHASIGSGSGQLAAHPDGPMVFAFSEQQICGAACRIGGASIRYTTTANVVLVCRGQLPIHIQTNFGAVGRLADAGWVPLGGSFGDISSPYGGCYNASNGLLLFGGTRIRQLQLDGGFRFMSPAQGTDEWTDFAEPSFGLTAIGPAQRLAVYDGGTWTVVANRGGLAADPWVRGLALPDGRLGLVGYEAFTVVSQGSLESVRWPWGSLRTEGWGVTIDGTGTVWIAGTFTKDGDTSTKVVGVKPN